MITYKGKKIDTVAVAIETFLPNYHSRDDVARLNDLARINEDGWSDSDWLCQMVEASSLEHCIASYHSEEKYLLAEAMENAVTLALKHPKDFKGTDS